MEGYLIDRSIGAIRRAKEKGLRAVIPKANQLLLDFDTEEQYVLYKERVKRLNQSIPVVEVYNQPSKSGLPKRHLILEMECDIDPAGRLVLQQYLGSDPTREFLSFLRTLQDDPYPTILFERDEMKKKVKPKRPSVKTLVNKADKLASEYIRRKYADRTGACYCYTCGKREDSWKSIQCGHFISRGKYLTRWNVDNMRPQCIKCNIFSHGEQYLFGTLLSYDGINVAELTKLSRETKYSTRELAEEAIEKFTKLLKEMS